MLVGLAASVIAIAAVGFALVGPGTTPSAEAQVRAAVDGSIEVVDFRITIVSDNSLSIPGGRAEGEVDGANLHLAAPGIEMYLVDGIEWIVVDGEVVSSGPAEETLPPYGEASQKVIHAALASNSVVDGGAEVLNGVETNRFLIEIDDAAHAALRALPPETTRWFTEDTEEEIVVDSDGNETAGTYRSGFLEEADSLVIWIADDLVHQISVDSGNSQFTHTFYDFGADITVTAPE